MTTNDSSPDLDTEIDTGEEEDIDKEEDDVEMTADEVEKQIVISDIIENMPVNTEKKVDTSFLNFASTTSNQYIDLRNNGRFFPSWIMKNFKKYKLPEIIHKDNEDPCNVKKKLELRKYQEFVGQYLGPKSPYSSILLYHGLGSGKTATCINLINIFYNYDPNLNVIILIKAILRDDPWMKDLLIWLGKDKNGEFAQEDLQKRPSFSTLHFVHYDSPKAGEDFLNVMKKIDTSKRTIFIIDEVHNFIRNVYSNMTSKTGNRAMIIYEKISQMKVDTPDTRIILISATPGINTPFELALMFNLLRPNIFPSSESDFNTLFISDSKYPILNPARRNLFERRISGLVSYYIGSTSDLYAKRNLHYVNLTMSEYQYSVYRNFEKKEAEIMEKTRMMNRGRKKRIGNKLYRTYTRQACDFVFPDVDKDVNGTRRPRPGNFRITEEMADLVHKAESVDKKKKEINQDVKEQVAKYMQALQMYVSRTEKYFQNINKKDKTNGYTIMDDLAEFKKNFTTKYKSKFKRFYKLGVRGEKRSELFMQLYDCSPKILAATFMSYICKGKVMIYSNYVLMEGIDMIKVYLRLIGMNEYKHAQEGMGFCEFDGRVPKEEKLQIKRDFNSKENIYGKICKIFLLSPSGSEGIQLYNILQEHIIEPYWTEVRIDQVIGRGVRQCSHKELPMDERVVDIYRYKVVKPDNLEEGDTTRFTADEYVEDQAKAKDNLIQSFLTSMKENAVDCSLFEAHNKMTQSYYCFQYPIDSVMEKNVGPAYKEDIKEDIKYDIGLHAKNSRVERIKVIEITGVYLMNEIDVDEKNEKPIYSTRDKFYYHSQSGIVFDYDGKYPVGIIKINNGIPNKLDKDVYIITNRINIPSI